ncbi:MAG: peptidoglycan D,D-transpeptidase FtsI family protein [Chloroflexia bacterium]
MRSTLNPPQAARPRKLDAWRMWAVVALFVAFGIYNGSKLFSLQVLRYEDLSKQSEGGIKWKDNLPPTRGLIYDSRGQLLAGNTTAEDVYVDKTNLLINKTLPDEAKMHRVADLLAPVLGQRSDDLFTKIKDADSSNIRVAVRLDEKAAAQVRDTISKNQKDLLYKVRFETQPVRKYPAGTLAASVLGFTDHENAGHYGVEESYNAKLAGEAGWIIAEHDAMGRPLVLQQPEMKPAVDGSDLTLTLDTAIQYLAERELAASIQEFKADSGFILVQDPNTGGILALANSPSFDPNNFNKITDYSLFKSPVVNDVIEPGSTMKILTYASAIDAGAVAPGTTFMARACVLKYGWTLCNATSTAYGLESMTQGLGRSDNISSMFAAEQLGQTRFFQYLRAFGIGKRTGVDLAGEVSGLINFPGDTYYSPINLFTNSFGQGVATPPIQLITAVSAVANGGKLLKPHIMKELSKDGKVTDTFQTQQIRRVIKPETATQIADMLAYGVENGLVARYSHVPGYHVSVKTGTAQIPEDGGYAAGGSFASAMGFAPSHDAKFTMYIGFVNPKSSQWGENTASRSWGRLAKELLMYLKVQPTEPIPTATPTPSP